MESYSQPHGGGENILFMSGIYGEDEYANETVTASMNSTEHRQNILEPVYNSEGIGVVESTEGTIYTTEDFC